MRNSMISTTIQKWMIHFIQIQQQATMMTILLKKNTMTMMILNTITTMNMITNIHLESEDLEDLELV